MDQAQTEFETALDMARRGREMWLEAPGPANFRIWRDASETAIRCHPGRSAALLPLPAGVIVAETSRLSGGDGCRFLAAGIERLPPLHCRAEPTR
jgi:hypothetical protein